MTWLVAYFGLGVIFLGVVLLRAPRNGRLDWTGAVLGGLLVVLLWPVFGGLALWQKLFPKSLSEAESAAFRVDRADLLHRMTIAEIERRETPLDPLRAAPELPFGHLNGSWRRFLSSVSPTEELWIFKSRRTTEWGEDEVRIGYVALRGDAIGPHFEISRRSVDEWAK